MTSYSYFIDPGLLSISVASPGLLSISLANPGLTPDSLFFGFLGEVLAMYDFS